MIRNFKTEPVIPFRMEPLSDNTKGFWFILLILFPLLIYLSSCTGDKIPLDTSGYYYYRVPVQTDDGWETASLTSVGINEQPLLNLLYRLSLTEEHLMHSLLIVKDGKLVFEQYFPGEKFNLAQYTGETGFDLNDTHNLCSATKSFTSALTGIAIDKGFITSVDKRIFDFFPEYADILHSSPEKGEITIKNLLTMRAGLAWDDESTSYFDPQNDMNRMFNSRDPIRYVLSRDLIEIPGTIFAYRNGNTNVVGEIIHKACDESLDTFSENYLFSKLGITDFEWQMISDDVVFCSGDLRLRPRDMAKFGYLFLNGGSWQGEPVISRAWIDSSTAQQVVLQQTWADLDGYGYQWWLWEDINDLAFTAYAASGWGGQWIIVWPEKHTVFVTTAGNYYTPEAIPIESLLADYLIPSINPGMIKILP